MLFVRKGTGVAFLRLEVLCGTSTNVDAVGEVQGVGVGAEVELAAGGGTGRATRRRIRFREPKPGVGRCVGLDLVERRWLIFSDEKVRKQCRTLKQSDVVL